MGPGEEQWGQWGQEGSSGGVAHWDHPGGPKSHCPHRTPWESCVPKCPQMSPNVPYVSLRLWGGTVLFPLPLLPHKPPPGFCYGAGMYVCPSLRHHSPTVGTYGDVWGRRLGPFGAVWGQGSVSPRALVGL